MHEKEIPNTMEADPERKDIPKGDYKAKASFTKRDGKGEKVNLNVYNFSTTTQEKLRSAFISEAVGLGLHNFGMDVNIENYPNGHPVVFEVYNQSGALVDTFTQYFNGNGHRVK